MLVVFVFVKTRVSFVNSVRYNSNLICIIQGECPEKFETSPNATSQLIRLNYCLPEEGTKKEDLFSNFSIIANVLKEYTNNVYISRDKASVIISFYIKGEYVSFKAKQSHESFELEDIQNFHYLMKIMKCVESSEDL